MLHELRLCLRSLRSRPLHSAVVVITLALGLAATVTVFTYVNGFSQPFPGVDTDRLVQIFAAEDDERFARISYLDFVDLSRGEGPFESVAAAVSSFGASVRLDDRTEVVFGEAVSGDFFHLLDIDMALGRRLLPSDDRPGADAVVVISHSWWQRSFQASTTVLGKTVLLNYRPHTIVGVTSPSYKGSLSGFRPEVWMPTEAYKARYVAWAARSEMRDVPLVRVYARLGEGVGLDAASDALKGTAAGLDATFPRAERSARRFHVAPATWISPSTREAEAPMIRVMMVAVAVLLLLVCANVVNLLLAIATTRRREMAMRTALGASPVRLVRQVLLENVVLSGLAGGIAVLLTGPLAARLGRFFARPSVWGTDVAREIEVDARVLVFAVAISLLTGLAAGVPSAIRAVRGNVAYVLKVATAGTRKRRGFLGNRLPKPQEFLVSTQIALAVVLVVVAGLVLRTLGSASSVDPGFRYGTLLASHVSTSSTDLTPAERGSFFRDLMTELREEPWVEAVSLASTATLSPHGSRSLLLEGEGEPASLTSTSVIDGFFETLRIDLLAGRAFEPADTTGGADVVVVNRAVASRYFPDGHTVGRRIWSLAPDGDAQREYEIVGVVENASIQEFPGEPEPVVYFAYAQHDYPTGAALHVVSGIDPASAAPRLRRWLRAYEPHLAIVNVLPYTEVVRGFLYGQRMRTELFSALAVLGLALATVGVFSIVTLAVSRRTAEIGIRMAIGATRRSVRRLVMGRVLVMVTIGVGGGLIASAVAGRLLSDILHGVEPRDPLTLVTSASILILAAFLGAYVPTHRAASVDPARALQGD